MSMCVVILIIVLYACPTTADQHQYKIIIENLTTEYLDENCLNAKFNVFKFKNANAINATLRGKCDFPENVKVSIEGFKLIGSEYRVPVFQLSKKLKDALEMELFDLQRVFIHIVRPPMTWPLRKGITYRMDGWVPDSTKFPPHLPDGKWRGILTVEFPNKAKILVEHIYLTIEYYNCPILVVVLSKIVNVVFKDYVQLN